MGFEEDLHKYFVVKYILQYLQYPNSLKNPLKSYFPLEIEVTYLLTSLRKLAKLSRLPSESAEFYFLKNFKESSSYVCVIT